MYNLYNKNRTDDLGGQKSEEDITFLYGLSLLNKRIQFMYTTITIGNNDIVMVFGYRLPSLYYGVSYAATNHVFYSANIFF
jgi:hypothetical protein